MDSGKFDDLIRNLGTARVTRLTALRGLVGGAVAAVAGTAIATSDADAKSKKRGKSKKKGKKKSRRSQAPAPVYNDAPAAPQKPRDDKPGDGKTPTDGTTSGPICDKYEDCGYGAEWHEDECRCVCKNDYKEYCESDYDPYLYGTCVDTRCEEYFEYNSETCKCEEVCYPPKDGCGYGEWDYKTCSCTCEGEYYEICDSEHAYDPYLVGTCVDTKCDEYSEYDRGTCQCKEICYPPEYGCDYGYEWDYNECRCIEVKV